MTTWQKGAHAGARLPYDLRPEDEPPATTPSQVDEPVTVIVTNPTAVYVHFSAKRILAPRDTITLAATRRQAETLQRDWPRLTIEVVED